MPTNEIAITHPIVRCVVDLGEVRSGDLLLVHGNLIIGRAPSSVPLALPAPANEKPRRRQPKNASQNAIVTAMLSILSRPSATPMTAPMLKEELLDAGLKLTVYNYRDARTYARRKGWIKSIVPPGAHRSMTNYEITKDGQEVFRSHTETTLRVVA